MTIEQELELLLLAVMLPRWHRLLNACGGDLAQAQGVRRMLEGA